MKHFWQYPSNMVLPRVPHSLPRHGMVFWNLEAVGLAFPEAATKCLFSLYSMKHSVQKPLFSGVPKYMQPAFLHLLVPVLSPGVRAA